MESDTIPPPLSVPALPKNATPEEKDRHWFTHVYEGAHMPQLTLRAVIMGGVLGGLMSLAHLYTTLKIGWSFGVAITACVLSFVIWNTLRAFSGGRFTRMSILENNCMQSTASAAGYSRRAGKALGALLLITGEHVSWWVALTFVFFTASLGVFLAIPMKRQMINWDQLAFPTGTAAAETLRSLYSTGIEAAQKARALIIAMATGALVGAARQWLSILAVLKEKGRNVAGAEAVGRWLHIPDSLPLGSQRLIGLSFEPSVLLIGAGMIVGLRISLSMLAGSALLYFLVAPMLADQDAARSAVAGFVPNFAYRPDGSFVPFRWGVWGGSTLMVVASLMSLALNWRTVARAFRLRVRGGADADLAAIEVPFSWMVAGVIPIGIAAVIVQAVAFQISIPLGILAVIMSFPIALVCCRATGETDVTPTGPMGKVTQLLYAGLPGAKGVASINLMAAGVTSAAGAAAADLLQDLKSGYLLGANPRRQFLAQFAGVFFGALAIVPAWYLMIPDAKTLEAMNPPATLAWKAVAELLTQGFAALPHSARWAIVIGALLGMGLPALERLAPKARPFLPSAMGLGLSWVMPFQNTLSFAIGAVVTWAWMQCCKPSAEKFNVPAASGLIAGEALASAVIAITATTIGLTLKQVVAP